MAITGSGTQADPYLVHSYDELKTVTTVNLYCENYGHKYIELDADIDCNDYGDSFEWETIRLGHDYRGFTLDLGGHTIKNIAVKINNMVFDASYTGSNTYGGWHSEFVGNGKILNIFTQPSSTAYLITGDGIRKASNLSLSSCLGNLSAGVFMNIFVEKSAIYVEQAETSSSGALVLYSNNNVGSSALCTLKNCDVLLKSNNIHICLVNSYHANDSYTTIDNCRIRGKIKATALPRYYICPHKISNSVIDLDATEAEYDSSVQPLSRNPMKNSSSGVINWDKRASNQPSDTPSLYTCGMVSASNSEIVNGQALRDKGFYVINVSGD